MIGVARLSPGVRLHLASAVTPLWQATEDFMKITNMSPPFWAFAWPGGEALALHVAENPKLVAGKRVLDFGSGCGLAAIICARAGARVWAADTDRLARAAIRLNAAANDVAVEVLEGDATGMACEWDVILAGDVFYEKPMTSHILPWLRACAAEATVIAADPGRAYVPRTGVTEIARYNVPVSRELEDRDERVVRLLRVTA
jgi:predicted nicotinamide N-methyase